MPDAYSLREIFESMTLELIASQKRTFLRHQGQQRLEGFVWEQWQLAKLRDMARYRRENQKIIGSFSQEIEKLIDEVLQQSFLTGKQRADQAAGLLFPGGRTNRVFTSQEGTFFGMNNQRLRTLQKVVRNDIKAAERAVLRRMDDVYRQTLYKSQIFLDSGAVSLNQAIDMATRDFLESGINCVKYRDGRRANVTSYAEMSLRTASQRATMLGEGESRAEWGVHTIVVTAHANTCDLCLTWQGEVLIDDVYSGGRADGKHELLSTAMGAGLLHPNCRHTLATYFPGISNLPKQVDDEKALANYEAEQKQRNMERHVRKWKRIEAGSLDAENVSKANDKVKEWQGKLREHLQENPQLRRDYSREKLLPATVRAQDYNVLKGTLTSDNIQIREISQHLIDQASTRNVSISGIEEALRNPLKIGNIRVDKDGRPSKTYIGQKVTVSVNPETGRLITTYKTSTKRARKLKDDNHVD